MDTLRAFLTWKRKAFMFKTIICAVVITVSAFSLSTSALGQSALGPANGFNVFVFGNMTVSGGEAEGAVAVGGNLTMNNSYNTTIKSGTLATLTGLTKTDNTLGTLNNISAYVGNNLSASSNNINGGGSVYVRNTESGSLNFNGGAGKLYTGSPAVYPTGYNYAVDPSVFSKQQTFSEAQTAQLASLAPTITSGQNYAGVTFVDQNEYDIDITKPAGSITYVSVTGAFLSSLQNPRIEIKGLSDTSTLVINVTGSSVTNTAFSLLNDAHSNHYANVLWNFASATTIDIANHSFEGSILAPYAAVDQNQLLEGNLVANSLTGHGYEEHFVTDDAQFTGTLPNSLSVPEPTVSYLAVSMVASGLTLVLRRSRCADMASK